MSRMKIYCVGGAIRDELLGLPVKERDWVVVGATEAELLAQGFKRVGLSFPVFLHPDTHEEYALARTERKTGPGYAGFVVDTLSPVTLEEDLRRRDLTINAIALDEDGRLIDPFHGREDIVHKVLRHVSPAFAEDPVRILRVARFAARFGDFTVAPETLELMKTLVRSGEVDALVPERVWKEFSRALQTAHPERFIEVLGQCGALRPLFPELDALFGLPFEGTAISRGGHALASLKQVVSWSEDPGVRFAVLFHEIGIGADSNLLIASFEKFRLSRRHRQLTLSLAEYRETIHRALGLTPEELHVLLWACNAFRNPERFHGLLIACHAEWAARPGHEDASYPQEPYLREVLQACLSIDAPQVLAGLEDAEAKKQAIVQAQLAEIRRVAR